MREKEKIKRIQSYLIKMRDHINDGRLQSDTGQLMKELDEAIAACQDVIDNHLDFREIADHLFIPIHIADSDTRILYVNSAYETLSGLHAEDILGHTTIELEGTLYRGSVSEKVVKEKQRVTSAAVCFGSGKENMVVGTPVFDEAGNVKLVVVNNLDFPELLGMQKELMTLEKNSEKAQQELAYLRRQQTSSETIFYKSKSMAEVMSTAKMVAPTDVTVLITGDSGTGKELLADYIYQKSERVNKPFIKLNCAAIPPDLLESELFGYETGAFTGAKKGGKPGMFELANTGTILLDEIGDLPMSLQSKLLRVLQQRVVRRIGGTGDISLDIRIIASTNKNLKDAVKLGTFRNDLYYRLNVVPLEIAPLRERKEDIPYLSNEFCQCFCRKYHKRIMITESGMAALMEYDWPGNIRELENLMERMVVTNATGTLSGKNVYLALGIAHHSTVADTNDLKQAVQAYEQRLILAAIDRYGSIRRAAQALGVDHSTLVKKLKRTDSNPDKQ